VAGRIVRTMTDSMKRNAEITDSRLPDAVACMAWAFGAEASGLRGDPALEAYLLSKLDRLAKLIADWRGAEDHRLSRASTTITIVDACRSMRASRDLYTRFPEATVADLEASALASARAMSQPTADGHQWVLDTRQPWRVARLMVTLMAGYRLTGDASFLESMPKWFEFLEADVHDLGGLRYSSVDPLANVPWYTDHTLLELGNLWMLADDEPTKPIRERLRRFGQRVTTSYMHRGLPPGTHDYSAVPWPKAVWHNPPCAYGPAAIALLTDDGANVTLARYMIHHYTGIPGDFRYSSLILMHMAARLKSMTPQPMPDRYVVPDSSVRGVRGLDGDYAFVLHRGTSLWTAVGARVAARPERRYLGYWGTYSSVLAGVTPEIGSRPWKYIGDKNKDDPETGLFERRSSHRVTGWSFSDGDRIVSDGWAALGVSYRPMLGSYWAHMDPQRTDWQVHQVWLALGRRLVGLVTITPLTEQEAPYVANRVQFGFVERIEKKDDQHFVAEDFVVRLVDHNFPVVETGPCEAYCNEPVLRGIEIRQADRPTDAQPAAYAPGQTFYSLLTIDSSQAGAEPVRVDRRKHDELLAFDVTDETTHYLVLYRDQPGLVAVMPQELGIPAHASPHSGDAQKAAWLDRLRPNRHEPEKAHYWLASYSLMVFQWDVERPAVERAGS